MIFVEYVNININQLESRGRTSVKKIVSQIIKLYIIAAQQQRLCLLFVQNREEPENTKSKLPVFILMNKV